MPGKKRGYCCLAAVLSVLLFLSACAGNTPSETVKTTEAAARTSEVITETTEATTAASPVSETTTTTTTTTATTTSVTTEDTEPDTSDTDDAEPTSDITGDTPEQSESCVTETDISDISETDTTTEIAATSVSMSQTTTTAASTAAEKHDPSPPVINKVSSDGTSVFECEKGVIDYSNANSGYISAKYTGKKNIAKVRLTNGNVKYDYTLYPDGEYHYFPLSPGSGSYSVKMFEQADGNYYSDVVGGDFTAKISDDIKMFTFTNDYVRFSASSKCVAKASELCGGCETDLDKIAAIFTYVADTVSYDYELAATVKSFYIPDPDTTLATKKGVCFDYSALMAAMLRSQGVPTRLLIGYASDVYHAWNEVYTTETGWVTPEVLLSSKGFNLLDSTFYSTANDKKFIADYMSNKANYSKIYTY